MTSWARRHSPPNRLSLLLIVLTASVFLVMAIRLESTRERLDHRRQEQTLIAELKGDVLALSALEGEAMEGGADVGEATKDLRPIRRELRSHLAAAAGLISPAVMRDLRRQLVAVNASLDRQLRFARRGKPALAEAVDRAGVDPGLERLRDMLDRESVEQGRAAKRESTAADVSTVALLLAGGLVVFGLFLTVNRLARGHASATRERRFRAMIERSSGVIAIVDGVGTLSSITGSPERLLGKAWSAMQGSSFLDHVHPRDRALANGYLEQARGSHGEGHRAELAMLHADGSSRSVELTGVDRTSDDDVRGVVLTVHDVSDRKAFEEQLRHRAFHDPLTHLANRALFADRITHCLSRDRDSDQQVAVLFIDCDDFKIVNERFGHAGGDEALTSLATRLQTAIRSGETLARLGGDQFAALLEDVTGADHAAASAERLLFALRQPVLVGEQPIELRASIGVCLSSRVDAGADDLLRRAHLAMYAAKREPGASFALYHPSMEGHGLERELGSWIGHLDEQRAEIAAILEGGRPMTTVFQPVLDLDTGEVGGYEALARFGDRPPNEWFAQAHRCGLGIRLEVAAVRKALRHGPPPFGGFLCVNVSPSVLRSPELLASLPKHLDGVVIEITENELAASGSRLDGAIAELRARGARIAADDAGAGYTGLRQLARLRPDIIKLDRGLVDGISQDEVKAALIDSFSRFAERVGASVCAEGVESTEDLVALAEHGVTHAQGYVIARPGEPWPTPSEEALSALSAAHAGGRSSAPQVA